MGKILTTSEQLREIADKINAERKEEKLRKLNQDIAVIVKEATAAAKEGFYKLNTEITGEQASLLQDLPFSFKIENVEGYPAKFVEPDQEMKVIISWSK